MKEYKPGVETEVKTKTTTSTKIALTTAIIAGILTVAAFVVTLFNI